MWSERGNERPPLDRAYAVGHIYIQTLCRLNRLCHALSVYLCEDLIGSLAFRFLDDTEHKLDEVSHILETEGDETKLVFYSTLDRERLIVRPSQSRIKLILNVPGLWQWGCMFSVWVCHRWPAPTRRAALGQRNADPVDDCCGSPGHTSPIKHTRKENQQLIHHKNDLSRPDSPCLQQWQWG